MNNYVFNKLHNANNGKHKYIAEYINRNTGRPKLNLEQLIIKII